MFVAASLVSTALIAQPRGGRGLGPGQGAGPAWDDEDRPASRIEFILDDLTEDQKTELEALRLEHYKEMKDFRNQMGEIRAKQRTIMSEYNVDTKAAESLIDQKTALMNKQMKARIAHQADVKKVLTEEQFLKLEQARQKRQFAHRGGNGFRGGNGAGPLAQGRGQGYGQGPRGAGQGYGPCGAGAGPGFGR